jgi:hypothetical protein
MRVLAALEYLLKLLLRVGALIAFLALFMLYLPLIELSLAPLLDYLMFTEIIKANPYWFQVLVSGMLLVGVAIVLSIVKGWLENMVDILFADDQPQKPRSSL